ncbi:MAG: hypothetical protein H8E76_10090 [Helicobacteraceae bacterium]|nr:hypothetical protein [Candidatus Sulfurimonas ponti]MBL6973568.1 hypothetical protein [Sulfurimonas sp.]
MSISSISSNQTYQVTAGNATKSSSLSSEQKALIEDVLSQYDAQSLSKDDAKAIVEAFQEAGIEPSKALESAMSASGFDAKEVGTLAEVGKGGGGRPMGPPPPPAEEEILTITELLESLLEEAEEDEATTSSLTTASTSPYEDTSSFTAFNTILDYTNQIVNLKDDAKNEVMSILEEYNVSEEQQDAQKSVVNSLNDILNKPQNYNRISFYA